VAFTDGLMDIGDQYDTMLGSTGVAEMLWEHCQAVSDLALGASEAAEAVMSRLIVGALTQGQVRDDICLLVAIVEASKSEPAT